MIYATRSLALTLCLCFVVSWGFALPQESDSAYRPKANATHNRSDGLFWLSFILPGYGQWKENQKPWAWIYSGAAVAGLSYAGAGLIWDESGPTFGGESRHAVIGLQLYQTAGSLSAFHAFRTIVRSKQKEGKYLFLETEESPTEILTAAFRFDYLLRPTTIIPLAAIAALVFLVDAERVVFGDISLGDAFFTGAVSYQAGTGEEALFRGAFMPTLQHVWGKKWLSNLVQATAFALVHLDPDNLFVPWAQFFGGLYLGWLTQYRNWTISESIFFHAWYDVIVLSAAYASGDRNLRIRFPSIRIAF